MNSLLLGLYACVFATGHSFPSEKQMIYTLLGGENWLIKISFQGGAPRRYAQPGTWRSTTVCAVKSVTRLADGLSQLH